MKKYLPRIECLYELYICIKKSGLPERKQSDLIRALLVGEEWSWRVVGISRNALTKYARNDFDKPGGIQRHHLKPFVETSSPMLKEIMLKDEWCKQVYDTEEVCLVTTEEHKSNISPIIDIDFELGLFRNQSIGFCYRKKKGSCILKRIGK